MTLFPLDFPKIYNFSSEDVSKKASQLKDELKEEALALDEQFMQLKATELELKREIKYASDDEKLKYGYALTDFTKTLKK
jgi:hypothetical protein